MWVIYWEWEEWETITTSDERFFINKPDCNESHWLVPGTNG